MSTESLSTPGRAFTYPDLDPPLVYGAPIYLFRPKMEPGAPSQIFGRKGMIRPGQVFCECHLQELVGGQVICELEERGHIRVVGRVDLEGPLARYTPEFEAELVEKWKVANLDRLPLEEQRKLRRVIHTRTSRPEAEGAPIYEVCEHRAVMGISGPLAALELLAASWFHVDLPRAAEMAKEYFEDRAIREVGVFEAHGVVKFSAEADFKAAPPKLKSLVDVSQIKGGLARHAPIFMVQKDLGGLEQGALVSLSVVPLVPPAGLSGEEGTRAALKELVWSGALRRIGVIEEDPQGQPCVVAFDGPDDYLAPPITPFPSMAKAKR